MKPGVTASQAQAEIRALAPQIVREHPERNNFGGFVKPLSEHVSDEFTIAQRSSPSEPDGQFTTHTLLRHVMLEPPGPAPQLLFGPQAAPGNEPFGKQAFSRAGGMPGSRHEKPWPHMPLLHALTHTLFAAWAQVNVGSAKVQSDSP